ncbi:MAG: hypothetical protein R3C39_11875 [Dehalococcoidia bacterium]
MRKLALIGAIALAMFAMACTSSDDDSSNGDATATATATSTGGDGSGSGPGDGSGGGTGGGNGDGSGSASGGNPLDVLGLFGDAEYQVTYNTEGTSSEGGISGTMTIFQKQDRQRVDLNTEQDGEAFEVTTINTPDGTIFCLLSEQTCLSAALPGGDPSAFATDFLDEVRDDPEVDLNPIGQRTIAGATAECFEATDPDGTGTTCISEEGVPLLVDFQGTDGSTWKMEATEYSTSVSDDDFEPPFEVTSFGF